MDVRIFNPFNMVVAGPTGCGKTHFVLRLIKEGAFKEPFEKVYYFYCIWQKCFDELKDQVEFVQGFPTEMLDNLEKHFPGTQHVLCLYDDCFTDAASSTSLVEMFVRGSHHLLI